jgi:CRISPR-associated protein Csb2
MIAIGIRYLTKYAVATNLARQRAEWPPHFGRVFMALTAAHFESGADPAERAALEWLEAAAPPAMLASDAEERSLVRAYVPVNDDHSGIFGRARQERAFPRVRPHDDCVYFIWSAPPSMETCWTFCARR